MTRALFDLSALSGLSGEIACVTGDSSGLGRRAATVLAQAGAHVAGIARGNRRGRKGVRPGEKQSRFPGRNLTGGQAIV